jgi:hypothetical protein
MDLSETRIVGALLLLSGFSFLAVGLYADQLSFVWKILREVYRAAIAGAP